MRRIDGTDSLIELIVCKIYGLENGEIILIEHDLGNYPNKAGKKRF
jgi:hypothetical protein